MQHLVGSDILQSSLSYHTYTSSSQISLWREGPIAESESARNREQGEVGALTKRELSKTTVVFVSGFWKPVVVKLVSICFGCLARTCHSRSVEDASVFQGTHRCLKCKCSLAACCQRVAHGSPGRLAHDAPTFGAGSHAGTTTV